MASRVDASLVLQSDVDLESVTSTTSNVLTAYGLVHGTYFLLANSEGPSESAHLRRIIRAFAASIHKIFIQTKTGISTGS